MTFYLSSRHKSGIPVIIDAIKALTDDEIVYDNEGIPTGEIISRQFIILDDLGNPTGKTRSKLDGFSIHLSSNIQGTTPAIVNVQADSDVLTALDADSRFEALPHPQETGANGDSRPLATAEKTFIKSQLNLTDIEVEGMTVSDEYALLKTAYNSGERHSRDKVRRNLKQIIATIKKAKVVIARKNEFRQNRENKRKALVALKRDLVAMRGGTFTGNISDVIAKIESVYENTQSFKVNLIVDDETIVTKYDKDEILKGVRRGVKSGISIVIQSENGLNVRIQSHVDARDKLIDEIADLRVALEGVVVDGQNLEDRKNELRSRLGVFGA